MSCNDPSANRDGRALSSPITLSETPRSTSCTRTPSTRITGWSTTSECWILPPRVPTRTATNDAQQQKTHEHFFFSCLSRFYELLFLFLLFALFFTTFKKIKELPLFIICKKKRRTRVNFLSKHVL